MIDYDKLPLNYILCIDMKSFFASVECVRRDLDPLTAKLAVVSNLDLDGGLVLASSPVMKKKYGIKTGSRKFEIPKDKDIILVPPSMNLYIKINGMVNKIYEDYVSSEDILPYSIDESLVDITHSLNTIKKNPWQIAQIISNRLKDELGLIATIGIGDNPLLSKLALDNSAKHKECGIAYWSYDTIPETVWKIPKLRNMWGIGPGYEKKFMELGINSVYKLAHFNKDILEKNFGIIGLQHYYHANGVDYSNIRDLVPAKSKSYSEGQVLLKDYSNKDEIIIIIREMVESLASRLRKHDNIAGLIHLNIGYSKTYNHKSTNKQVSLPFSTNITKILQNVAVDLFKEIYEGYPVRQLMISLGKVENSKNAQISFFEPNNKSSLKKLDKVMDEIREQHSKTAIFYGYSMMEGSTFKERAEKTGGHKAMSNYDSNLY